MKISNSVFKLTYFPLDVIPMITTTLEISFAVWATTPLTLWLKLKNLI